MKLIYLANIRLPTEKAHGLQIMKTCEALTNNGTKVFLYVPKRKNAITTDPFEYYRVKKNFEIKQMKTFDLTGWGPAKLTFILNQILFAIGGLFIKIKEDEIVYSRDEYSLYLLSFFGKQLFFESHDDRYNFMLKRLLKKAAGVVCVTKGLMDFYTNKGLVKDKLLLASNGVDLVEFGNSQNINPEAILNDLGLPKGKKLVVYTGHLYEWKGVDVLVEAVRLLAKDVAAVFVGGTSHDVKRFKEKYEGVNNLVILGQKPHTLMPLYLAVADVLVMPNSGKTAIGELYTSPVKMFEYMAVGKPIVASNLPSITEVLNDSNSVLVKADDAHALAQGIQKVLADGDFSEQISKKAQTDAALYSWQKRAEKIMSFVSKSNNNESQSHRGTEFYDNESHKYSAKRYPEKSIDYAHSFYLRRIAIVKNMLREITGDFDKPSLLEVGCADGIILEKIFGEFGNQFSSYKGIDISPKMIEVASKRLKSTGINFAVRKEGSDFGEGNPSIIIEIGVLNYTDISKELLCAKTTLPKNGYYICSIAGKDSLWDKRRKSPTGFAHFRQYKEYEAQLRQTFEVVSIVPVGLFIPIIWRFPVFARPVQVFAETLFSPIAPNLFHEKLYLLRNK